eukprot:372318_1
MSAILADPGMAGALTADQKKALLGHKIRVGTELGAGKAVAPVAGKLGAGLLLAKPFDEVKAAQNVAQSVTGKPRKDLDALLKAAEAMRDKAKNGEPVD